MEGAIQTKRHRYANENEQNGEDEGIELNLGLSMNGRFGVDPLRKKLKRSSSISSLVFTVGGGDNNHARGMAFGSYAPLMRTRSLPTETEEEWMRRKEVESMRRMEARKKRMEKLKNVNNGGVSVQRVLSVSQGSIGSVRSGSSGSSDLENQQTEGPKQSSSVRFPSNGHSQEQESAGQGKRRNESLLKPAMMEMPHVTTKEDGPNGNKVEGFLYRYKMGEEVKIVCVCHGMFLSPAEFVKHGGGGDVEQPLKHIVVSPFPIS